MSFLKVKLLAFSEVAKHVSDNTIKALIVVLMVISVSLYFLARISTSLIPGVPLRGFASVGWLPDSVTNNSSGSFALHTKPDAAEYCVFTQYLCLTRLSPSSTTRVTLSARCCTKR